MPEKLWFVNIRGETFGPIGTSVVMGMLKENRLQFTDFLWTEGLTRWQRIQDLHEFAALIPPYPTGRIPTAEHLEQAEPSITFRQPQPVALVPEAPPLPGAIKIPDAQRPVRTGPSPKAKFRRNARVELDAHVSVEGHGLFEAVDISGGGLLLKGRDGIRISTDVKFRIESAHFSKVLDMTGVVVREEVCGGHVEFAIEFTRVNPSHKRVIQEYVTQKLAEAA